SVAGGLRAQGCSARKWRRSAPGTGTAYQRPEKRGTPRAGSRRLSRSFGNLRLVPADIERNSDDQVRAAAHGFAILVRLALERAHHPNVAIIVTAELALGIRSFQRGREQPRRAERPDELLVVITEYREELFDGPFDFDRAEVHIVRSVGLVVGAAIVSDGLQLLI